MSDTIIYAQGRQEIAVPSAEKIAVFTQGSALVYQEVGYPNFPSKLDFLGTVENEQTVFGAYASGATIIVENQGAAPVFCNVGTAPVTVEYARGPFQGAPTAMTTTANITAGGILSKIITGAHTAGATQTYTLPTGTLLDAALELDIGEYVDWTLINLSAAAADTITLAAAAGGHTLVGVVLVPSSHISTGGLTGQNTARMRTRKTAANTFVSYRLG